MSAELPNQDAVEALSDRAVKLSYALKSQCERLLGEEDAECSTMDELEFERYTNPAFQQLYEATLSSSLESANAILSMVGSALKGCLPTPHGPGKYFTDADDLLDNFDLVVDALDNVYEKIDVGLDRMSGRLQESAFVNAAQSAPMMAEFSQVVESKKIDVKLIHAQNITRPQLRFLEKIDNSAAPFRPKIIEKPNAIVSLPDQFTNSTVSTAYHFPHPYEYEIGNIQYPLSQLEPTTTIAYLPLESTPYEWIDTEARLAALSAYLSTVSEMAVDLENHNYRSYQGFCCLMQISTRERDFLIDAIELRHHMHILNASFTSPKILKVLHGAASDVQWLQRDFGLYLVNLFDTFFASRLLEFPSHSLAFLLKHYVNVNADKRFQLADWRIRPLPTEMVKYAREDTHYLLYIYDMLKSELLSRTHEPQKLLKSVYHKSAQLALEKYEKEAYDELESWKATYFKYQKPLGLAQMNVFKALHAWRDHVAREEDESVRYVLPNHMLLTIAERMPTDTPGILGCCTPVPPLVRQHATDLGLLIQRAKMATTDPLVKPSKPASTEQKESNALASATFDSDTLALGSVDSGSAQSLLDTPVIVPEGIRAPLQETSGGSSFMSAFGKSPQPTKSRVELLKSIQGSLSITPVATPHTELKQGLQIAAPAVAHSPERAAESAIEDDASVGLATEPLVEFLPLTKKPKLDLRQFMEPRGPTPAIAEPSRPVPNVVPFDYEAEAPRPALPAAAPPSHGKKHARRQGFHPYANIEEPKEFKKKERQSHVQPSSGNRSMTFQ